MASEAGAFLVYIVDDDASVRKALTRLMRSIALESRAYDSAERFLAEISNRPHACILMDITMPSMDGFELAGRLVQKGITIPVIAVSARDDEEVRRRAHEMGARFFLRKPVDDQALLDAISWVASDGG